MWILTLSLQREKGIHPVFKNSNKIREILRFSLRQHMIKHEVRAGAFEEHSDRKGLNLRVASDLGTLDGVVMGFTKPCNTLQDLPFDPVRLPSALAHTDRGSQNMAMSYIEVAWDAWLSSAISGW